MVFIIAVLSAELSNSQPVNLLQKTWIKRKEHYKIQQKVFSNTKMRKEILTFGDIEIEKNKFYRCKIPIC